MAKSPSISQHICVLLALLGSLVLGLYLYAATLQWKCQNLPGALVHTGGQQGAFLRNFSFVHAEPLLADAQQFTENSGFLLYRTGIDHEVLYSGVSMFHQLHCLSGLRDKLLGPEIDERSEHAHDEAPEHQRLHLAHCLDYLAQAIVCAADDTLEWAHVNVLSSGQIKPLVAGIGVEHQCRNVNVLWETIQESQKQPLLVKQAPRNGENLRDILRRS